MSEAPRRRWPRRLLIGVLAFLVLFYVGGGLYFSNVLNERALDGAALRTTLDPDYDLVVRDVAGRAITITPDGDPGSLAQEGVVRPAVGGRLRTGEPHPRHGAATRSRDGSC